MKNFIVFLTCLILLFSCSREKINHKVRFYGHVQDVYTQYPVANAQISIRTHWYAHSGPSNDNVLSNLGTTDAQGNFDFETKGIYKDKYVGERYMNFDGPGVNETFYSGRWPMGSIDNRENQMDVKLFTMARLKFVFINTNPFDSNDMVNQVYIERPWGEQLFQGGSPVLTGMNVDTTLWTSHYGYTTSVLHYTVTKNSVSNNYTDTIYSPDPYDGYWLPDTIAY